jgi:DNA-binding LacI/PurR family transcriptional regulator
MPTVREIASRAGVSKTTVSLVLNNRDGVSDALRQRVRDALREMENQANGKTLSIRELQPEGGPLSIGLLHSSGMEATQFFRDILQGIQAAVDRYQAQLRLISFSSENQDLTKHLYFKDETLRPDGILMVESRFADLAFPQLQKLGVPTALVGSPSYNLAIAATAPNEIDEGCRAARYLLEMGHRNIGFVFARLQARYAHERLQGYKQALQEYGIEPPDRWIAVSEDDSAVRRVLADSPEITAILLSNQAAARVSLPAVHKIGYGIPERLSVLVFDDTDEARAHDPPLTTVAYPLFEEGFWAVRMLLDLLREPQMEHFHITFRAKIIERASCAPPIQRLALS